MGPRLPIQYLYSDGSKELEKAAEELKTIHGTSTPERPESNGRAERAVRIVEGTRAALVQSGFPPSMWPWAVKHYCFFKKYGN